MRGGQSIAKDDGLLMKARIYLLVQGQGFGVWSLAYVNQPHGLERHEL